MQVGYLMLNVQLEPVLKPHRLCLASIVPPPLDISQTKEEIEKQIVRRI